MSTLTKRLVTQHPRVRSWMDRIWAQVGSVSVRTKILGIVLTLTTILGLGITWQVRSVMERVFISELENRGTSVVSDLASRSTDPILLNDTYALYQLLTDTVTNHPDALYAFVQDRKGQVVAHTFGDTGFPTGLWTLETMRNPPAGSEATIRQVLYVSNEGRVHEFAAPIFDGRSGVVHLGLTENRLHGIVNAVTGQMLLTTLIVALAGIAAATLLTWLLTQPILNLVETTRQVGSGDLTVRAPHWADDEIGALADAFNQMVSDLSASQRAIAEKDAARTRLLEQLITAQEEERKRIARELHDGVGQALTSMIVGIKVACQQDSSADMQAQAEEVRRVAAETLEQVRLLSRQLRPSVLDDLGLSAALDRYAAEFSQLYPNLTVDVHCDLTQRLPPTIEIILYRVIQEAMTNAARHSKGSTVSVLVTQRGDHIQAIIEDNGEGFDYAATLRSGRSVGIHGMAERIELVGGTLNIESGEDGTTVYVDLQV